jgi:hypothetical protein
MENKSSRESREDAPSRSTLVKTIYPKPHRLIASAVFSGSCGSNGGGALDVLTEQNRQPRVHVSPISWEGRLVSQPWARAEKANHDCSSSSTSTFLLCGTFFSTPTVTNIRTSCFLTDGVETQSSKIPLYLVEGLPRRYGRLKVGR